MSRYAAYKYISGQIGRMISAEKKNSHNPAPIIQVTTVFSVLILGAIGMIFRYRGLPRIQGDMAECLIPWYEELASGHGIGALKNYSGNYGLPYVTILWLLHFIPGAVHIKIKTVSILFEYMAALGVGLLASHFYNGIKKYIAFIIGFGLTILYPVLILNGAYWGQCDGIYSAFTIFAIYALFKGKPSTGFILLGCALAFKLQAIFILPFLVLFLISKRTSALWKFILIPVTVEILYIPGIIAGYSPLSPITIYLGQTSDYQQMYMYYPGLWTYFWRWAEYEIFHLPVIGWVAMVYALLLLILIKYGKYADDRTWIGTALLTIMIAVYFLPAIHERYGMLAELIAIVYAIIHPKRAWITLYIWITIFWSIYQPMFLSRWPEQDLNAMGLMITIIAIAVFCVKDIADACRRYNKSENLDPEQIKNHAAKAWTFFDKYIPVAVYAVVLAIVIISRRNLIRVYTPDYLSDLMEGSENYHTAIYMLYIRILDAACRITDKETYFLLKISVMLFDLFAAGLWTVIISKIIPRRMDSGQTATVNKLNYRYSFAIAYLLLPTTAFYSAIGGRVDGLCLILTGIGILFLDKNIKTHKKSYSIISGIAFGLAVSIIPSYILFILGLYPCTVLWSRTAFKPLNKYNAQAETSSGTSNDKIRSMNIILSALCGVMLSGLSCIPSYELIPKYYLALIGSFRISGSVITPVCFLLLILAYEDHRFLLPLLLMEFAAIMSIGRYMGVIDTKYLFLITTFIAISTVIAISTFISKLYSQLTAR